MFAGPVNDILHVADFTFQYRSKHLIRVPRIDCWDSLASSVTDWHKTSEMPLKGKDCSPEGCNSDAVTLLVLRSQRIPTTLFQRPPDVSQQNGLSVKLKVISTNNRIRYLFKVSICNH